MANFFPPYRCDKYTATQDKIMAQRKANTSFKNILTCPHEDHVPCKSQCYDWVGGTGCKIMNQNTHTHPISVKQNNGIQVISHVWSMELSWTASHVKVEHISSDLKMLQTEFVMVEKVKVSKTTMHFSQQR